MQKTEYHSFVLNNNPFCMCVSLSIHPQKDIKFDIYVLTIMNHAVIYVGHFDMLNSFPCNIYSGVGQLDHVINLLLVFF